jgi:prolyl-tRNA synthetase
VYGSAVVHGLAKLIQGADVRQESHWLCLGPIGSQNRHLTAFRKTDSSVCVTTGCFYGTPEELLKQANKAHRGENRKYYREYSAAMKLVKEWAKQWKEEEECERSEIQTGCDGYESVIEG